MKNKYLFVILLCMTCLCALALISNSYADIGFGKATVYGKVTDSDGITPCANVQVNIKLGTLHSPFPWNEKKAYTDSDGNYTAEISFPKMVEIQFHAEALQTDSLPFKNGSNWVGFYNQPPEDNGSYELNITLKDYSNAAIIQGYLEDEQTGLPLHNYVIWIKTSASTGTSILYTNSKGFYKGLVNNVGDAKASLTLTTSTNEETVYIKQGKSLSVNAGKAYTINFQLERDTTQSYVYGIMTEADTGDPISYATVRFSKPNNRYGDSTAITDFLGRYKKSLKAGTYYLSTFGANTIVADRSQYTRQSQKIEVGQDEKKRIDIEMVKK